ncbi:hypothetical protein [Francisella tularensis]|uniref:hypothetical protein n=1 Tax=Francisella tularensis TaxID=263 RepID=UPI00018553B4|nr:hypothetical protein [Francisella tularensis]EDZ90857.1 hypothetical protein FTG_0849 [Francisella tularensis subsp. novicida FTG]MBK2335675.1 hypothetical protein [Francisella tularensis subsp. novicida]
MEKKVLFLLNGYDPNNNKDLVNLLINKFLEDNYKVDVVSSLISKQYIKKQNLKIIGLKVGKLKYLKYFFPSLFNFFVLLYSVFLRKKYISVFALAPLSINPLSSFLLKFINSRRKIVIIWDIFPIAQVKIGSITKKLHMLFYLVEKFLIKFSTNYIYCMGKNNKRYIKFYYSIECFEFIIHPIWMDKKLITVFDHNMNKKDKRLKFVFGGQIIQGRDFNNLIKHFTFLRQQNYNIELYLYTKNNKCAENIKANNDWIHIKQFCKTREEYIKELSFYDFGIVVTDKKVGLPTMPSKFIDYLSAGIKTYFWVERQCEWRMFLKENKAQGVFFKDDYYEAIDPNEIVFFNETNIINNSKIIDILDISGLYRKINES